MGEPTELACYWDMTNLHTGDPNNPWNNDKTENPANYLIRTGDYELVPHPENCATLTTPYNIRSDGIIMAQNIESYAYTLNSTATEVDTLVNQVHAFEVWVKKEFERQEKEIQYCLSQISMFNTMMWIDMGMSIVGSVGGAALKAVGAIGETTAKVAIDGGAKTIEMGVKEGETVAKVVEDGLEVTGRVATDTLNVSQDLTVAGGATVEGEVKAGSATVHGELKAASATVDGTLESTELTVGDASASAHIEKTPEC
jgi:hypothetical protein